jgi:23S rRNA pseudouridine1911/1915/1917 synthase
MPPVELFCSKGDRDQTVAAVLKARLGMPWAKVKKIIEGRHVKIGGQVEANPARRVRPGLRIEVAIHVVDKEAVGSKQLAVGSKQPAGKKQSAVGSKRSAGKKQSVTNAKKPIRITNHESRITNHESIVYADDAVVVVNKPAGLTTMRHEEEAAEFGKGKRFLPKTLADLLPHWLGEPSRPVIAVHRIDRDTSGLVVFARNRKAADHLTDQFRKHTAERRYIALVRGVPKSGRIESKLVTDRGDGRRGSGTGPDEKKAVTFIKVVEKLGDFAAVECRLETGRTHQVRIHLGEASTPLCGEKIYDRPVNGKPFPDGSGATRSMLHAAKLGFVHPATGEMMTWDVSPPADFAGLWAKLRKV